MRILAREKPQKKNTRRPWLSFASVANFRVHVRAVNTSMKLWLCSIANSPVAGKTKSSWRPGGFWENRASARLPSWRRLSKRQWPSGRGNIKKPSCRRDDEGMLTAGELLLHILLLKHLFLDKEKRMTSLYIEQEGKAFPLDHPVVFLNPKIIMLHNMYYITIVLINDGCGLPYTREMCLYDGKGKRRSFALPRCQLTPPMYASAIINSAPVHEFHEYEEPSCRQDDFVISTTGEFCSHADQC